jgi:hypothetical protein
MPTVRSITRFPVDLPYPVSGAAVADGRFLVGPGIIEFTQGAFVQRITPASLPQVLCAAVYEEAEDSITVYSGHLAGQPTLILQAASRFNTLDGRLLSSDTSFFPHGGRKGMAAVSHGHAALLIGGQTAEGQQPPTGFLHLPAGDPTTIGDDTLTDIPLTEGMPVPTAPIGVGTVIVECKPSGGVRRFLVLGTGHAEITEIVRVKKQPRVKLSGIHMPHETRMGGACSLFGGNGFGYAAGLNENNQPDDRIILWDGSGNPSVSGERLPMPLISPSCLPLTDTSFLVAGGSTGQGVETGTGSVACFEVQCA